MTTVNQTTETVKSIITYKELITQSQEQVELEDLELTIQEQKSTLEVQIATMKRDLSLAIRETNEAMRAIPYNVIKEKASSSKVKAIEETLEFAIKVLKERF